MHNTLAQRMSEIADFSIRVYGERESRFVQQPMNDDELKCSQEVIAIGASWLDIFSRSVDDRTDGAGLTRYVIS